MPSIIQNHCWFLKSLWNASSITSPLLLSSNTLGFRLYLVPLVSAYYMTGAYLFWLLLSMLKKNPTQCPSHFHACLRPIMPQSCSSFCSPIAAAHRDINSPITVPINLGRCTQWNQLSLKLTVPINLLSPSVSDNTRPISVIWHVSDTTISPLFKWTCVGPWAQWSPA